MEDVWFVIDLNENLSTSQAAELGVTMANVFEDLEEARGSRTGEARWSLTGLGAFADRWRDEVQAVPPSPSRALEIGLRLCS